MINKKCNIFTAQLAKTCSFKNTFEKVDKEKVRIWSEWRLTVNAATVRIALGIFWICLRLIYLLGCFYTPQWAGAEDGEGIRPAAGTGNE